MADKPKYKMPIEERAKQFMPFSALTGLGRALLKTEKEKVKVAKKLPDRDKEEELSRKLTQITLDSEVMIIYFQNGEYLKVIGKVKYVNRERMCIGVNGKEIKIEDIAEINL